MLINIGNGVWGRKGPLLPFQFEVVDGFLYNAYAVENIIKDGWAILTSNDLEMLKSYLGGENNANLLLKKEENGGNNEFGFSWVMSGWRAGELVGNDFNARGSWGHIWTQYDGNVATNLRLDSSLQNFNIINTTALAIKRRGFGLRAWQNYDSNVHGVLNDGNEAPPYYGNDGKKYNTIKLFDYIVTTTNLIETRYNDGTFIPLIENREEWSNLTTGARCSYDNNENFSYIKT